jgi:hypothetical protein
MTGEIACIYERRITYGNRMPPASDTAQARPGDITDFGAGAGH